MSRQYILTGELLRQDDPADGTKIQYEVKEDNSEVWSLIEGHNSKFHNQTAIEVEYSDLKPIRIYSIRGNKVFDMEFVTLCDIVNLVNGIDIMKDSRRMSKLTAGVKVVNIERTNPDIEKLKQDLNSFSDEKIKKILEIANSEAE